MTTTDSDNQVLFKEVVYGVVVEKREYRDNDRYLVLDNERAVNMQRVTRIIDCP